jgi:hypothetical protein
MNRHCLYLADCAVVFSLQTMNDIGFSVKPRDSILPCLVEKNAKRHVWITACLVSKNNIGNAVLYDKKEAQSQGKAIMNTFSRDVLSFI